VNSIFRDRLDTKIEAALSEAKNCGALDPRGMVGTVREIVVEQLKMPLLPDGFYVGAGKIADHQGGLRTLSGARKSNRALFRNQVTLE
jgi:hypothetical protein